MSEMIISFEPCFASEWKPASLILIHKKCEEKRALNEGGQWVIGNYTKASIYLNDRGIRQCRLVHAVLLINTFSINHNLLIVLLAQK